MNRILGILLLLTFQPCTLSAGERILLAADTQVIEVNREGLVTDLLKSPGHTGIYDAWRLPDGGIAYAHRDGLAVFDAAKNLVLQHAAKRGSQGAEANSCAVLQGGARFALMDSGVCRICIVDRSGAVISETALPDLSEDAIHFRYRMIREVPGKNAFWVGQYARKTLLEVESSSGEVIKKLPLETLLQPSSAVQKCFAVVPALDGSLFVATSTGCQLLHLDAEGKRLSCWTAEQLGLACRYLLGMQQLHTGNVLIACGDYHLKTAAEGRDVLAELDSSGKVVWRLTRDQLIVQVDGPVDPGTGMEELRISNVHVYDSDRLQECLNVRR